MHGDLNIAIAYDYDGAFIREWTISNGAILTWRFLRYRWTGFEPTIYCL